MNTVYGMVMGFFFSVYYSTIYTDDVSKLGLLDLGRGAGVVCRGEEKLG